MIGIEIINDYDYKYSLTIDFSDADAEFLMTLSQRENIYAVKNNQELVGLALIEKGTKAFVYVYIDPRHRKKGYGSKAIDLIENDLIKSGSKEIMTTCRRGQTFCHDRAYERRYSSAMMTYKGPAFEVGSLPIRQYQAEDFEVTHKLYAEAFHQMRLSVGDFPDSKPQVATEKMKNHWAETPEGRLVYIKDKQVVAYARLSSNEIASISVDMAYQGQGIGSQFMKYVCNEILENHDQVDLYCVVGNKARHLYDKLGFKEVYVGEYLIKKLEA